MSGLQKALPVRRLGGTTQNRYCIEIQGYYPGPTAVLAHLERLPGLRVLSKCSWVLTDDFDAEFEYKGYRFCLDTPFAYVWVQSLSPDVPEALFRELEAHVVAYRRVPFFRGIAASIRYLLLPWTPRG